MYTVHEVEQHYIALIGPHAVLTVTKQPEIHVRGEDEKVT